jgi:hypothetical protein
MKTNHAAQRVFNTHIEAESRMKKFSQAGFGRKKSSIMNKDCQTEDDASSHYNTDEHMLDRENHEAFWGGLWGMLFGLALFVVGSALFVLPDIGPLLVFGPPASWVVGILGGAIVVGGLGTLAAALLDTGRPEKNCRSHETATAKSLLESSGASHIDVHRSIASHNS